jgi:hypothetical protein
MLAAFGGTAGWTAAATAEEGPYPHEHDERDYEYSDEDGQVGNVAGDHGKGSSCISVCQFID